uniref:carbonyl reductase (NADPH) n=2 Tax=Macrostomum lignano TaxID=282301 RepID=A0A1I8G5G5_9PLAT
MASALKVAVVTGSNKGIGFAIVEQLCKQLGSSWAVYVTSRDEARGADALSQLKQRGVEPRFHQLDIDSQESVDRLAAYLKGTYGGLDILVNNAGIAYKGDSTAPFAEQAEVTIATNFWSTLRVCDALFPLLKPHARVVHLCSSVSDMALNKASPELQKKLTQPMSLDEVKQLMSDFVARAKAGPVQEAGWPQTAYGVSKVGVRLMTYAQARDIKGDDIVINCCCPGYVDTDMSSHRGPKTIYEGADTPVYLATLPPGIKEPIGEHLYERKVVPWAVKPDFKFVAMASALKVAVVTGSNKGIGFAIVEQLCKQLGSSWAVYLTSRDKARGADALSQLKKRGVEPRFHQLDIDSQESVDRLAAYLKGTYGGLDILVNNAAIAYKGDSTAPFAEQAEVTIATNFWNTLRVCDALFPLLKPHARVVHLCSSVSDMALNKASPELQKKLTQPMSLDEVKQLMSDFVARAKAGTVQEAGWPQTAYGVSKVGVRLMTYAQARDIKGDDIVINCCCPGYVDTDMTSHKGPKTIYEGADTPVYLATLPPGIKEPIGEHLYERKVVPWAVKPGFTIA